MVAKALPDLKGLGPRQSALVRALQSGEYKQCRGRLHDGTGYCIMGVACLVAGLRHRKGSLLFKGHIGLLPPTIVKHFGLYSNQGECRRKVGPYRITGNLEECLTVMNDFGKTFPQIAIAILKNPRGYFAEPL